MIKKFGLYDPAFERDACGVGIVANIKGQPSHEIIQQGMQVLVSLAHRGATGADPETGDGAGLLIQLPHHFLLKECSDLGFQLPEQGHYGVGMIFLPNDPKQRKVCEQIVEQSIRSEGQALLGWRDVPTNNSSLGYLAKESQPTIRQFFIGQSSDIQDENQFELKLYLIRKVIERHVDQLQTPTREYFYISSLSSNRMVYKGLLMVNQVREFYPDLSNPLMTSSFVMVHARFSTNTLGSWRLAHPYRMICHNGEINTLRGNLNWMTARQTMFSSNKFGNDIDKLFPIITPGASDTASFDNALELLLSTGRSLPHSLMMMIPEATGDKVHMTQEKRDFYDYHSSLMEPWDGPALIAATDGKRICVILDRNGLRPFRYQITSDDLLVMSSETGVLDIPADRILSKSRIEPGRMFMLDTEEGRIVEDDELKHDLASRQPYGDWLNNNRIYIEDLPNVPELVTDNPDEIIQRMRSFGYTLEDLEFLISPMASTGSEPIGSMGNDAPLAVLSDRPQLLFGYFKQLFAQVSNPPLDAIREELVTSLEGWAGTGHNIFDEVPEHCSQLRLRHPVLDNNQLGKIRHINQENIKSTTISTLFDVSDGNGTLETALVSLCENVSSAVDQGYSIIILSDRGVDAGHAAIPSLLATSSVHHHLIREGTRMKVGLVIESGEPREVMHLALLIGYGAAAINPYLIFDVLHSPMGNKVLPIDITPQDAQANIIKALEKGILKVMSKMGISTVQSYRGAQIFEAVGLNRDFIEKHFTWTTSRIEGVGMATIEQESISRHSFGFDDNLWGNLDLDIGGVYQWRKDGEYHMVNPESISLLQHASWDNDYEKYREFSDIIDKREGNLATLRSLLDFKGIGNPIPIDEVEQASEIVKRFATGAISLGAISREAHETLAIATNRIGSKSNTGEGGEDYSRFTPDKNGDSRSSAIKQVASGRFGVTTNYLVNATDLQIKMAQGSKPGEGGQLPGHKVDEYIGWIRHTTPGVELISPPPHHDIYSIEDLAQLIHDLKNVNPMARIHVKLVAEVGVGIIAAGVAKGHGDVVLISGDSGGTGASPESSIKTAGLPWELGLAETQQVLVANNLRGRIIVQTDGQLKTGRDVAIACLMGAEEFGFATAPLITLGCIMLRKCHLNTCSVGIATQDPNLRKRFTGTPEAVINYFFFVAEHLREIMASMGFHKIEDMIGRMDYLDTTNAIDHWKAKGLDLGPLLEMPEVSEDVARYNTEKQNHGLDKALDIQLIDLAREAITNKSPVNITLPIRNSNRVVGTMLSGEVARLYGEQGLNEDTIQLKFTGSAGQSFGAFLAKGISMTLEGDSNDYLAKGISGGRIVVFPPKESMFIPEENIIVGNVVLYGATGGNVFIRGIAGERFAVRNSGANAVVEGVGDHCCEYMTGGQVVILGPTGRNFAAGMSGGIAYVLDENNDFIEKCNLDMIGIEPVATPEDVSDLRRLIEDHLKYTESGKARQILENWDSMLPKFIKVIPRDYKRVLANKNSKTSGAKTIG